MIHFGEQKGPFCEVKWAILKNDLDFSSVLYELFTDSRAFGLKKRAKNSAEFYGNFYLLPHPFSDKTVQEFPPTSASVSRQDAPVTFILEHRSADCSYDQSTYIKVIHYSI